MRLRWRHWIVWSDNTGPVPLTVSGNRMTQSEGIRNGAYSPGIKINLLGAGGYLKVEIDGAKCGDGSRGQVWRSLTFSIAEAGPVAAHLAARCAAAGGELVVSVSAQEDALRKAVVRAGKKSMPRLRAAITPYVFRHAFHSDLKVTFRDRALIAAAAGQQSDATLGLYGIQARGRRRHRGDRS